jgi:hypothetical protein
MFLFDHTSTTGDPPSTPPMRFPFYRVASPPTDHSGDHPAALHLEFSSPLTGLTPRRLHRRPPAAGRPDFASKPPAPMGRRPSLFLLCDERAMSAGPLSRARPSTSVGSAHCNSGISLLSFKLFKACESCHSYHPHLCTLHNTMHHTA